MQFTCRFVNTEKVENYATLRIDLSDHHSDLQLKVKLLGRKLHLPVALRTYEKAIPPFWFWFPSPLSAS